MCASILFFTGTVGLKGPNRPRLPFINAFSELILSASDTSERVCTFLTSVEKL